MSTCKGKKQPQYSGTASPSRRCAADRHRARDHHHLPPSSSSNNVPPPSSTIVLHRPHIFTPFLPSPTADPPSPALKPPEASVKPPSSSSSPPIAVVPGTITIFHHRPLRTTYHHHRPPSSTNFHSLSSVSDRRSTIACSQAAGSLGQAAFFLTFALPAASSPAPGVPPPSIAPSKMQNREIEEAPSLPVRESSNRSGTTTDCRASVQPRLQPRSVRRVQQQPIHQGPICVAATDLYSAPTPDISC
ncbi:hypothetical protein PIB30_053031 [Stylosanthes scabra]|uniref:Uncharacterized protein n=1 Tax=Stylosanthes scabra TaxID=79078 RepID=A0ABU6RIQ0_9FABA|nr:hypothetical protein [Stylosanthes scabra]